MAKDDRSNDTRMNDCYIASADEEMVTVDHGSFAYSSDGLMDNHCRQTIDSLFVLDNIKDGELLRSMQEEEEDRLTSVVDKSEGIESGLDEQSLAGNSLTCFDSVLVNSVSSKECESSSDSESPQAVVDYFRIKCCGDESRLKELKRTGVTITRLANKAKQHLEFSGWKLFNKKKKEETNQLCYTSPLSPDKCETTLKAACKRYIKENDLITTDDLKRLKGARNGSRNDFCKGFTENTNTTEGFVFTAKNPGVQCKEGKKRSKGFLSGRRENKSTHSCQTEAQGLSWGTRKVYCFVSTPLPANWQAIKGYYTEPRDTLDLDELDDEYDRELKQMVKENHIDQEKRKPKFDMERLKGCNFNFNEGL